MNIDPRHASHVTTQSYTPKTMIEGVEFLPLTWSADDGGNFSELWRLENGKVRGLQTPFEAKQISLSILVPGTIKAFHIHKRQDDLWYVPPTERLLVNLVDIREGSPTYEKQMRFVLGGSKSIMVRIPTGVAHGIANLYDRNMVMIYATSEQFSPSEPDEHRLPWDHFGTEMWQLTKG